MVLILLKSLSPPSWIPEHHPKLPCLSVSAWSGILTHKSNPFAELPVPALSYTQESSKLFNQGVWLGMCPGESAALLPQLAAGGQVGSHLLGIFHMHSSHPEA